MSKQLEITKHKKKDILQINISGRLDAYWSEQLSNSLEQSIHEGYHKLELNLESVDYISSAGIRVLIIYYKKLKELDGAFYLSAISDNVGHILEMVGMKNMFQEIPGKKKTTKGSKHEAIIIDNTTFDYQKIKEGEYMDCSFEGDPGPFIESGTISSNLYKEVFNGNKFGIGIGSLGKEQDDNTNYLGEFAGLGDAVVCLPADGTKIPDYYIKSGELIPEIRALYKIIFEGEFAGMINFTSNQPQALIPVSSLMDSFLDVTGFQNAGIVMLAEPKGLVGASLNNYPKKENSSGSLFDFPSIRDNINITTEPEHTGGLTVTTGVIFRQPSELLKKFTRPLNPEKDLWGHLHTVVFSFTPLKKNEKNLKNIIHFLFERSRIISLIHLINDDRELTGIGESEFKNGTCWIGQLKIK